MKRLVYLAGLVMAISVFLHQSTSYSNAELRSDITVSAVQDGQALISIHYGEGRQFWIVNNTDQAVFIRNHGGSYFMPIGSSTIAPARVQEFVILGDPGSFWDTVLSFEAEWHGGSAIIDSEIPESNLETILLELMDEENVEIEVFEEIEEEEEKEEEKEKEEEMLEGKQLEENKEDEVDISEVVQDTQVDEQSGLDQN